MLVVLVTVFPFRVVLMVRLIAGTPADRGIPEWEISKPGTEPAPECKRKIPGPPGVAESETERAEEGESKSESTEPQTAEPPEPAEAPEAQSPKPNPPEPAVAAVAEPAVAESSVERIAEAEAE